MFVRFLRHPVFLTAVATIIIVALSYAVTRVALMATGLEFPTVALELVIGLPGILVPVTMLPLLLILRRQKRLRVELERLAHTDALTGLPNRRAFFEFARRSLTVEMLPTTPLMAMMIDVDHFKRINDY